MPGIDRVTLQERRKPALEQGELDRRRAAVEPVGGERFVAEKPAEQGGQAMGSKGAVVLVALGDEFSFVIGIDGQPGEPQQGRWLGARPAREVEAGRLRRISPADRRDQKFAFRRRDGIDRDAMQQRRQAAQIAGQQSLAGQDLQRHVDRCPGPGAPVRGPHPAPGQALHERGLRGGQEHQALEPEHGLRPGREAGVPLPRVLDVQAGANRACHREAGMPDRQRSRNPQPPGYVGRAQRRGSVENPGHAIYIPV